MNTNDRNCSNSGKSSSSSSSSSNYSSSNGNNNNAAGISLRRSAASPPTLSEEILRSIEGWADLDLDSIDRPDRPRDSTSISLLAESCLLPPTRTVQEEFMDGTYAELYSVR